MPLSDKPANTSPGVAQDDPQAPAWHALTRDEVCAQMGVDARLGLSAAEAEGRLARNGPNRLAEKPPRSAWLRFSDQFKSTLILILVAAAALAYVVGDLKDAVVILVVVVLNALLGFYQENRAEQSLAALKKMLATQARVRRGGHPAEMDAQALVPGDIVLLEAGDKVPADGRLVEAHNLEIDESALTGESHTVGKHVEKLADAAAPLAERTNMAFMNTVVTRGRAELLIAATGDATEMGRIAHLMQQAPQEATPLQRQLDRLGKRLALIAGIVVALIFAIALVQEQTLAIAALTAITLAVAAIPEGLPAVVTVTLALGMRRMAGKQAIVKRLAAVETLGCTTVICSDKTGTLTLNQMTARSFLFAGRRHQVSGEGYSTDGAIALEDAVEGACAPADAADAANTADLHDLLLPAALCNDSRIRDGQLVGDPTEGALAALAAKGGIDALAAAERLPRIAEIPFD
jgi:Ca2+-transporting ATPase